jgi:type 1 glutamine amidotransferase
MENGTTPLLLGTGHPRDKKAAVRTNRFGTHHLEPEMTDVVAWTWTNKWGGRTFSTSLGHLNDFGDPNSVRFIINGIFWVADQKVPSADTKINPFEITSSKKKKKSK